MNNIAINQTMRIRRLFLKSILSQDMTWFDLNHNLDLATKITSNLDLIKDAIGEKLVTVVYFFVEFIISVAISMLIGWELTLVVTSVYTIWMVSLTIVIGKQEIRLTEREAESYSVAGSIAEEVFNSIRTVVAFGGEDKECKRYQESLRLAEESGIRKNFYSGLQSGLMWFLVFGIYGFCFYYGIHLMIRDRELSEDINTYNAGSILVILFCMLTSAQFLTLSIPSLETIITAKGVSKEIYNIIDQKSRIDPFSKDGMTFNDLKGNIEFRNVHFKYPSRNEVKVLKNINFQIKNGQTIALVGSSGSGKSTCLQLLQRLYDPTEGEVVIDGVDIKKINTAFLRSQIGVVGQEPVLFSGTITENIRFGNPKATQDEIINSAKTANIHSFIEKLPQGYETLLGENGAQLSGGQKQRIAIARAIVRNPRILLLDEATSALDNESERIVQKALDKASEGRTTLIVSHRLSSIQNANYIVVFNQGEIVETGSHEELIQQKGDYYKLRMAGKDSVNSDSCASSVEDTDQPECERKTNQSDEVDEYFSNDDPDKEQPKLEETNNHMIKIFKMSLMDWKLLAIGCICSLIVGASFPVNGLLFGYYFEVFQTEELDVMRSIALSNLLKCIALAFSAGIAALALTYSFGKAGIHLTTKLRVMYLEKALQQEIRWYDDPSNSVGALLARLSKDCANVQGATGIRISAILQAITSIIVGGAIGFVILWKLTFMILSLIPIQIAIAAFDSQYSKSSAVKEKKAMENVSRIAVEAISNIRTVASLGLEKHVLERFDQELKIAEKEALKSTRLRGLVFNFSHTLGLIAFVAPLVYAEPLISSGEIDYINTFMLIEVIITGVWFVGFALAGALNVNSAITSAQNIMSFLSSQPKLNRLEYGNAEENDQLTSSNVDYENIRFSYPTRSQIEVLKGLSLQVPEGKTIALVGPSGCGKTTCIQLLLRFYNPDQGEVKLDGVSTVDFSIRNLRSHLGLVSQEPVLFDRTIAENIAYGDNSRVVSMEEIIEAAKEAQIHSEFITKLPLGYDTPLGSRGTQLSGGQKQRIAIARALIRNPKVLLLDEATSALDAESEKTVQNALERASENRTCIVIAHRLSTIRNADLICVIDKGQIAEMGTHNDLMSLNGIYYKMYQSSVIVT
ncbi:multidrug resistance protein homolog 49-like [Phlebotomus papatasi]|uniref:multidrug resistance protein homolog 49-like n=1 Tax=Phlebotomus papatasi TaxID=29031 RepID=UPI0024846585|nr:multidrug resistance protein homolog 49-like [Phlebotomus papatasi]